ncbi:unnamed protein product, partial [Ectocarpus sp. 8 AP-2014]
RRAAARIGLADPFAAWGGDCSPSSASAASAAAASAASRAVLDIGDVDDELYALVDQKSSGEIGDAEFKAGLYRLLDIKHARSVALSQKESEERRRRMSSDNDGRRQQHHN